MGAFAGGMRVFRRRRRGFRRCCARGRGRRFLVQVDDSGSKVAVLRDNRQGQGREHEDKCGDDRKLAQEVRRSPAAEHGLAGAAEGRSDLGPLAGLQQNGPNHE